MDRVLLRALIIMLAGAAAVGCSGDDDKSGREEHDVKADASTSDDEVEDKGNDDKKNNDDKGTGGTGEDKDPVTVGSSCDGMKCSEPATCSEQDGEARCRCPEGYEDKQGDASECVKPKGCSAEQKRACGVKQCMLTDDGPECTCLAPAYVPDGDGCKCGENYTKTDEDLCLANDGQECGDDIDCAHEQCVGGICCAVSCDSPIEACRTAEGATCKDGKTCEYGIAKDGASCSDDNACVGGDTCKAGKCESGSEEVHCDDSNPCTDDSCDMKFGCKNQNNSAQCDDKNACTATDSCVGGTCVGSDATQCPSDPGDACNEGKCDPASGECGSAPVPDGKLCDDDSSCTLTDQCMAGSCTGQGNACGPNATQCTVGEPNACVCAADYLERDGKCVPQNDECQTNPCSENADCFDPSNAAGDVTCTCRPGFSGNGRECVVTEPCKDNPCGEGRGTCTPGPAGTYSCSCSPGYLATHDSCSCDLTGTHVIRSRTTLVWRGLDGLDDGEDISDDWAIARTKYDASGKLHMELTPCGSTTPDLCGAGTPPLLGREAYGQYLPQEIWGQPSMPTTVIDMEVPNAIPGARFETPQVVALLGIVLDDPRGEWPSSRRDVAGGPDFDGSAVNGARWVDIDNDGLVGLTSYVVPPGGIEIDGSAPEPLVAYGDRSEVCPRGSSGDRLAYQYLPAQEGLSLRRVKRFSSATRFVNAYIGNIESCDLTTGDLVGPDGSALVYESRFAGCVRVNGSDEVTCSSSLVDFMESTAEGQRIDNAKFILKRVADDITCKQARETSFD